MLSLNHKGYLTFCFFYMHMHELRKDYLLDEWVIIATSRSQRPQHLKHKAKRSPKSKCPFCPGHEDWTPKEIARYADKNGKWRKRVVPNKYPAVQTKGKIKKVNKEFLKAFTAFGTHEVIVETPDHNKDLADLSVGEIAELLQIYKERFLALSRIKRVKEITIFKNQGFSAGASLSHAHSQIIAVNKISERFGNELNAFEEYKRKKGSCPYCKIIKTELKSKRAVYNGKHIACFTPFASRAAYQLLFFPKAHRKNIAELSNAEFGEFAVALKKALLALKQLNADFNYFIHMPIKQDFHMHLNLMPRLLLRAGYEEATECIINIVAPEQAASFYRKYFKG